MKGFAQIKKVLVPAGIICLIVAMILIAEWQNKSVMYKGVDIRIYPEYAQSFVGREQIEKYIRASTDSNTIKAIDDIDVGALEKLVEQDPFVENAEIYTGADGILHVEVTQRNPICRVIKTDGSGFYIDVNGVKFPVAEFKPTKVIVVNGVINEAFVNNDTVRSAALKNVYTFCRFLDGDEFWRAMVDQVTIAANGDISFYTIIGNHRVLLGNVDYLDEKMRNLYIFYKKMMPLSGWTTYKVINLKYRGQVIGEK